ncbi:multidrug effflux MFS transporter [uncultured Draconibacterium sp.]|mgnify:CR=1 FL=1|uniref:multidrug effflux MFS transporter n=1 Tax=uncultured Draconibacterium sp. TaxID=1573823 RepID=UPI0025F99AE1|nr:multidrug effflux MFS transporter [uncultured Draconibacterium sp.]
MIRSKSENTTVSLFMWLVLGALMAFTSLSTDIYLPAMPQMQLDLQGDIELTVTGFLIGFAIAQIIWGPISDRYGRKMPLVIGLILFIIGSVGCAFSENITQILFARVVQALGACVGPMLSRAMVRDMLERTKAAEMLSTLMILMALAPIFGPLIGGQLLKFSSWQSIFWLLTIIGIVMLLTMKKLPETLPKEKRQNTSLWNAFKKYGVLLRNRKFMAYTLCVSFFYVGVYAFVAGSPEVYITYFGVDPQHYGWLFALNVFGIVSLSFANRILVRKYSLDFLLRVATTIAMIAGLVLLVTVKLQIGGIYGVIIPVFFFFSMNGIVAATTTAAALDKVPEMAGAAAALLGSLQYGSGILSTLLLTFFGDSESSPWTMSWIIAVFAIASAGTMLVRSLFGLLPIEIKRTPEEPGKAFAIYRTSWGNKKQ